MNIIRRIFGRKEDPTDEAKQPLPEGVDEETLALAKELAFDRKMAKTMKNSGRRGRKAAAEDGEDEFPGLNETREQVIGKVFARTVEDTVLANRFLDVASGKTVRGVSVRQRTAAMDGLRDIDPVNGDVGVDPAIAGPMNPEGRYRQPVPTICKGAGDVARRVNEAVNPRQYGNYDCVPEEILKHFAAFATFIGYPLCEVIAAHPTVSNACNIPAKDAISPGYKLKFVDSEDIDGNGVPDDEEPTEGVKRLTSDLQKTKAVASLRDSLKELGRPTDGESVVADHGALLRNLTLSIERLAAYEALRKDEGGERTDTGVLPLMTALCRIEENVTSEGRQQVFEATRDALVSLGEKVEEDLRVADARNRERKAVRAVRNALEAVSRKREDQLVSLAVAFETLAAYDKVSARNAELVKELGAAVTALSMDPQGERGSSVATGTLVKTVAAMDAGDFDFGLRGAEDVKQGKGIEEQAEENKKSEADPNAASAAEMPRRGEAEADGGLPQGLSPEQAMGIGAMPMGMMGDHPGPDPKDQVEKERKEKIKRQAEKSKLRQKMLDMWKQRADDMGVNNICRGLARNARIFGIGIAVPLVDGANYEEPFDLSKIARGSYHGFTLIEPTWIYPEVDSNDLVDPLSPYFFEPMYWALNHQRKIGGFVMQRIHRSWMVIVRHKEVPDMLRPMYYYGGISLCQEIYEAVFCADKLMNEAPKLAMCKRTTVVKGDPVDFIANPEGLVDRLRARSQVQDNFGILYVGRNADVQQLETSLSEFDQIIAKANQRVASIAQMPETKLFKTQLAGMNSAGRYEWDDYAQLLVDIENNWYTPLLTLHYKLDSQSQNGSPIAVRIEWNKIEIQTEQEQDQVASGRQQRVNNAIQAGYLSPDEGRTIMRTHDELFSALTAENPVEQDQQQQGGGMPGMPGMGGGDGDPGGGMGGGISPGMAQMALKGSPLKEPKEPKERK